MKIKILIGVGKNYFLPGWCLITLLNIYSTQAQNTCNYYHYLKEAISAWHDRTHLSVGSMWDPVFCSMLSVQPWRSTAVCPLKKRFHGTYCSLAILRLDWGANPPLEECCKVFPLLSSQLSPTEVSSHTQHWVLPLQSHRMVPSVSKQRAGSQNHWRIFIIKAWHFLNLIF